MTKVKVGMDDPSSVEFVERRRAALERQGSIDVSHGDIVNEMIANITFKLLLCFSTHKHKQSDPTMPTIRSGHKN